VTACSSGAACKSSETYACFRPLDAEIAACAHPFATPGKFDAANKVCSFGDGTTVEFPSDAFATSPTDSIVTWTVAVKKNGQPCLQFEVKNEGTLTSPITTKTLQTTRGTYKEVQRTTAITVHLAMTCPDGTTFDEIEVQRCKADAPHLGYAYGRYNSTMDLRLGTSSTGSGTELFRCSQ